MHIRCGLVIIHRTLIRFLTVFFVQFSINNGDSNNYGFNSMFGQKSVQGISEFTRKAVSDAHHNVHQYDTVQCYNCMSADIRKSWRALQEIYNKPLNFTDDCNYPAREMRLQTSTCSSMCITMIETVYVSGIPAGQNFIRGCLHQLTKAGFNNITLRKHGFEIFDICDKVPRSLLFRNKLFAIDDHVVVCSCWGSRCNGNKQVNAARGSVAGDGGRRPPSRKPDWFWWSPALSISKSLLLVALSLSIFCAQMV